MSTRVLRVRTSGPEPAEGTISFFAMRLAGRAAARVKLDDTITAALMRVAESDEGAPPTPTELSFAGDDELEALSRAEAWVRRQFTVLEVQNTRRRDRSDS